MEKPRSQTPIEALMAAGGAFREARVALLGVELGLFQALCKGPETAEGLARRQKLVPRAVRLICNALVALGFLRLSAGKYRLAPGLARHLDPESPHSRVHGLLHTAHVFHSWARLDAVARGEIMDPGAARKQRRTRETNRNFILAMQQLNPGRADELAAHLDLSGKKRLCDVGPGPGHYSLALARKYPGMEFTLVDDPDSLAVAREFVARSPRSVRSRFTYVPGDVVAEKRPDWGGPFDAILLSNVIHIFGAAENRAVVRKLARMLSPGGVLIVRDFAINDAHTAPPAGALFAVNMLANTRAGQCYSANEVKAWMKAARLSRIRALPFPPSYLVLGHRA